MNPPFPQHDHGHEVYRRLNELERAQATTSLLVQTLREEGQKRDEKLDAVRDMALSLRTAIWTVGAVLGFLVTIAGIVIPLMKG